MLSPTDSPPAAPSSQKIIKTADLSLEVKKFEDASREVDRLVTRYRGFYADNRVTQNDDGTTGAHIVVRVPQGSFEALYADLKKLGRVKAENAKGEDVTEKYTDLSARIRNSEALEKSLLVLLDEKKKNAKMSEIIEVQRELAKVREEIEKMLGTLRVMDNQIDFGTIYLTLAERTRSVPSGTLSIEVKDSAEADKDLDKVLGELGGQVASRNSSKRADGTSMVNATVKVPMPKFGQLIEALKRLGIRVDREEVRGYDLAAIVDDEGAKQVMATATVVLFEPSLQKPGGSARIEVETIDGAAAQPLRGAVDAGPQPQKQTAPQQRRGERAEARGHVLAAKKGRVGETYILGNANVSYSGRAFWNDVLGPEYYGFTDAYSIVNATVGVKLADGKATISLKGTNLLNEKIMQHIYGDLMRRSIVAELHFFAR
jgi:hypothetical protein